MTLRCMPAEHGAVRKNPTMRLTEYRDYLAARTPWPRRRVADCLRRLRAVGALVEPVGGREGPRVTAEAAAYALLALSAAAAPGEAEEALDTYATMTPEDETDFAGSLTFGQALTQMLADPGLARRVERVVICRSWPEAVVDYRDGDGAPATASFARPVGAHERFPAHADVVLEGELVAELAERLAGAGAGG